MLNRIIIVLMTATSILACSPQNKTSTPANEAETQAQQFVEPELISRELIFGNADKWQGRISPDGKMMSWLAPLDGVQNIWLAPVDRPQEAKAVTRDTQRGIHLHMWSLDSKSVLYTQDQGGNENDHIYAVDANTGDIRDLTDIPDDAKAQIQAVSLQRPGVLLVGLNTRDRQLFDLYEIDIASGQRTLITENPGFGGWVVDNNLKPVLALKPNADGSADYVKQVNGEWQSFMSVPAQDMLTSSIVGFDKQNQHFYMRDSRKRDKSALVKVNVESGESALVAESDKADIQQVMVHPQTRELLGYSVNYLTSDWYGVTEQASDDFTAIAAQLDGNFQVLAMTNDGNQWVMYADAPQAPGVYYVYNRTNRKVSKMFDTKAELAQQPLQPMQALEIPSRDGKALVSYLTLPAVTDTDQDGKADKAAPLVLTVHGGPWARDEYGFNSWHQWLANRGYAVLSVNYRGSTGFGKSFVNAAVGEFSGKMHDDLIDAVEWAINEGIAEPDKVAIMGASYGGYATLVGLTFTPERFACGVDLVGPSSLVTLVESFPEYWRPWLATTWYKYVGDPIDPAQREDMLARSPISRIDDIRSPLLIGQGANDPRVTKLESDQMVEAMQASQKPVTYINYPDEGHGFARPENNKSFSAVTEGFLAECLGGRYEPIGDDFENASMQVLAGAEHVKGLSQALQNLN